MVSFIVAAASFAGPRDARAVPVDYVIDSGMTGNMTGTFSGVISISGSFTFDVATNTESSVDLIVTGPSPFAGTYVEDATDVAQLLTSNHIVCGSSATHGLCLNFHDPLNGTTDSVHIIGFGPGNPDDPAQALDLNAVGSGSPASTSSDLPDPGSLSLLAGTIALYRIRQRGRGLK